MALADARSDRLDVGVCVGVGLRVRERVAVFVAGGEAVLERLPCIVMVTEADAPIETVADAEAVADVATTDDDRASLTNMDKTELTPLQPCHQS